MFLKRLIISIFLLQDYLFEATQEISDVLPTQPTTTNLSSCLDRYYENLYLQQYGYYIGQIGINNNNKYINLEINVFDGFYLDNLEIQIRPDSNDSLDIGRFYSNISVFNLTDYIYIFLPIPDDLNITNPESIFQFQFQFQFQFWTNISSHIYGYGNTPNVYRSFHFMTEFNYRIKLNCYQDNNTFTNSNLINIDNQIMIFYNSFTDRYQSIWKFNLSQWNTINNSDIINIYFGPIIPEDDLDLSNNSNSNCHYIFDLLNLIDLNDGINLICSYKGLTLDETYQYLITSSSINNTNLLYNKYFNLQDIQDIQETSETIQFPYYSWEIESADFSNRLINKYKMVFLIFCSIY